MGIIYAVLRNGMWDDPAVASTGAIAQSFQKRVADGGFGSERVAPYLTWRLCYLLCGVVFCAARLGVGVPTLLEGGSQYEAFLQKQLPKAIPKERFDSLISLLAVEDLAMFIFLSVSFWLLAAGTFTACPHHAVRMASLSRRLIWLSWAVAVIPPFLFFLVFPVRSVVDWDAVVADACTFSIRAALNSPGTDLNSYINFAAQEGFLESGMEGLADDPFNWCSEKGVDWHDHFYNVTVTCAWKMEDACVSNVCNNVLDAERIQCLTSCLPFAVDKFGRTQTRKALLGKTAICTANVKEFSLGPKPARPKGLDQKNPLAGASVLYDQMKYAQRRATFEGSEVVTLASVQAEYVVGMLVGVVAGKYLICAALSLLGVLAEAALNTKAMFPGSQDPGWLLILVTFEVLPIHVALLAIFQQLIGDGWLCVVCVLAALFTSLGVLTGTRILAIKNGDAEREKMYRRVWVEYALRVILGLGILGALLMWSAQNNVGLREYIMKELLTLDVIVAAVLDFYSKKIVTAVAGTDAVVSAFVQSERWRSKWSEEELRFHWSAVEELKRLADPSQKQCKVHVADVVGAQTA